MTHMYDKVAELVIKHHTGEISEEEKTELNNIWEKSGLAPKMLEELLNGKRLADDHKLTPLQKQLGIVRSLVKTAAIIILIAMPWYLYYKNRKPDNFSYSANPVSLSQHTRHSEAAVAANNSYMTFEEMDLQHLLRQLSKDPELEVIYSKGIKPLTVTGDISSSTPYEKFAQDLLEANGYKSTIKGKKIIVYS